MNRRTTVVAFCTADALCDVAYRHQTLVFAGHTPPNTHPSDYHTLFHVHRHLTGPSFRVSAGRQQPGGRRADGAPARERSGPAGAAAAAAGPAAGAAAAAAGGPAAAAECADHSAGGRCGRPDAADTREWRAGQKAL